MNRVKKTMIAIIVGVLLAAVQAAAAGTAIDNTGPGGSEAGMASPDQLAGVETNMIGPSSTTPKNVSAKPLSGGVRLQWQAVKGSYGYRIYWEQDKPVDRNSPRLAEIPRDRRQYDVLGLSPNIRYHFRVSSVRGPTEGPLSYEVAATPMAGEKTAPSDAAP